MTQDEKKRRAAQAALEQIEAGQIVGVGTGTTTNHFIDGLAALRDRVRGAVPSSRATAERLRAIEIPLVDLAEAGRLALYVDGADEATRRRELIKGGGGALTREKILAQASERFLCILDDAKIVTTLGKFPLPVEVIELALPLVAREIEELGGRVVERDGFVTDNGHRILDVHDLPLGDPRAMEEALNQIPGVVTNGLFCRRPADRLLIGTADGVEEV